MHASVPFPPQHQDCACHMPLETLLYMTTSSNHCISIVHRNNLIHHIERNGNVKGTQMESRVFIDGSWPYRSRLVDVRR